MRRKCGCVVATAKNTASVRKGFELGGYIKKFCARHGESDPDAGGTEICTLQAENAVGVLSTELPPDAVLESAPLELPHRILQNRETFETLTKIVRAKLGFFAARRVKHLACFSEGWDGEDAHALTGESSALMAAFLHSMEKFPTTPSIFLTRDGFLAMSWEDRMGQRIDVVFEKESYGVCSSRVTGYFRAKWPQQIQDLARSLAGLSQHDT